MHLKRINDHRDSSKKTTEKLKTICQLFVANRYWQQQQKTEDRAFA